MKKEKQVYNGKLLKVFVKEMTLPNGFDVKVEIIKHPGAVLIVPIFDDGRILLIRQFRAAINKYIWEFPAGTLEKGEKPVDCARREIIEETGYKAGKLEKIQEIVPVPGYSTERIIIYKATRLAKVTKKAMADEVISEEIFDREDIAQMLRSGEIIDAKTICALSFLFLEGHTFWK
jgi:ADP-ribose pyrophosphatase